METAESGAKSNNIKNTIKRIVKKPHFNRKEKMYR